MSDIYWDMDFDVAVVGAGHAGIEAALAAARMGARTALFTLSLDDIGNMPCNPAIGGPGKSQLVFELDALGGEMPRAADAAGIESRTLNLAKGPAVHSLRVQCGRADYHRYMKLALERQPGLQLIQDEVVEITVREGRVEYLLGAMGHRVRARAAVICSGTYLGGKIFVGDFSRQSGPDGSLAATRLAASLLRLGAPLRRRKTGTPARVLRRSVDLSRLEVQPGDPEPTPFSSLTDPRSLCNSALCYITYTNPETHRIIRENLHRSPLFGGAIEGIGPRYCPSIEDKVVRFPDRQRHQIFIEPCGEDTEELYLQGMSSSLPLDVQYRMYRSIAGLERCEITRPAYAIEYDCVDPLWLSPTLMSKTVEGLFGAGQFCGTSGYEEAAAQGLVAGANAAALALGREPLVLTRDSSYIGTLIDDIVTKGVKDPYRMMTARSEYRLSLRQDNADLRLAPTGHRLGLLDQRRWEIFLQRKQQLSRELERLRSTKIPPSPRLRELLTGLGQNPPEQPMALSELLRRPGVSYGVLRELDPGPAPEGAVSRRAEIELKYEGYLKRQQNQIQRQARMEGALLPTGIDYLSITGLRTEAAQKLSEIRPLSLGQASRISGVNPADMAVLAVWLERYRRRKEE